MDTRRRILEATADLLERQPADSVSTRAVCEAAGVTPPTLYHHFGDKDGLFDAVVTFGFETHLADRHALAPTSDPVADLRTAWDAHVAFGVGHPSLYTLMYGSTRTRSPAADEAESLFTALLARVAAAGRLRLEIQQATSFVSAACTGTTLRAIGASDPDAADVRDVVIGAVLRDDGGAAAEPHPLAAAANQLAAVLADPELVGHRLAAEELGLLHLWLGRLSTQH